MTSQLNEKIAIGYVCSGETFREITLYQLENNCVDDENLYYLILTDKKEYFDQCTRKNLIVNELKEFYSEYPEVEPFEYFIETDSATEYYDKLLSDNKFSFSIYRFHLIQAQRLGITNVAMLCVDTCIDYKDLAKRGAFYDVLNSIVKTKNKLYNAVAIYGTTKHDSPQLELTWKILKEKYNYETDDKIVPTIDAAARLFVFKNEEQMMYLFRIWNEMVVHLYQTGDIIHYLGSRVVNDEFLLGPIYHMAGIKQFDSGPFAVDHRIMNVFWEGFGNVRFNQQYVEEKGLVVRNQ